MKIAQHVSAGESSAQDEVPQGRLNHFSMHISVVPTGLDLFRSKPSTGVLGYFHVVPAGLASPPVFTSILELFPQPVIPVYKLIGRDWLYSRALRKEVGVQIQMELEEFPSRLAWNRPLVR